MDANTAPAEHCSPPARRRRARLLVRVLAYGFLLALAKVIGCNGLFYYPDSRTYREPDDLATPCEEVFFASGDGTRLHGWFLPSAAPGGALGTVVHFHGNAQNLTSHAYFVEWLPERGFNVFTFDYRGYGKSEGKPSRAGLHLDSLAALEYVRGRDDVDPQRLLVLGQSLGGACALAALGEGEPARSRAGVRAVAVESTFLWYRDVANSALGGTFITYPLAWLLISNEHSPGNSLAALEGIPLLAFHAGDDEVVGLENGRAVFEAWPGPKDFVVVPGANHLRALEGETREKLVEFFRGALGGSR
jgi:hypothetical protein